ncbi:S24/S26 family peptidase [Catenovulum sp. 2E275]|uniref:S24/S26 family peptidase n=1 Tax=Catenovulum sp. 2E275 TaxID=2980497 RepID=UPI003976232A
MSPLIPSGSYIIFCPWFKLNGFKLKPGDIIKVTHPQYGLLVKSIHQIMPNGDYLLTGLNPHSITTEQMGLITQQQILAKAIKIIKPKPSV